MNLQDAIDRCHVRSCVRRRSAPDIKYAKNHSIKIIDRVPTQDALATDWEEWDPRDDDDSSLFMFND